MKRSLLLLVDCQRPVPVPTALTDKHTHTHSHIRPYIDTPSGLERYSHSTRTHTYTLKHPHINMLSFGLFQNEELHVHAQNQRR